MKPILILSTFYALAMASPAYAYLDPVTGSFILQALVGGIASIMIAVRRVRERILAMLGLGKTVIEESNSAEDASK